MTTITRVAPTNSTFPQDDVQHCTSGRILSLALSADPSRIYAGSFAGVWRSDDSGQTFYQLIGPLTDTAGPGIFGGVYAPHIFDLAASPVDANLVLAAARDGQFTTNRDGIYRSADGGHSWELVLQVNTAPSLGVSQVLFAPDDPNLVYAERGIHQVGIIRSKQHLAHAQAWSSINLKNQLPRVPTIRRAINSVAAGGELSIARR